MHFATLIFWNRTVANVKLIERRRKLKDAGYRNSLAAWRPLYRGVVVFAAVLLFAWNQWMLVPLRDAVTEISCTFPVTVDKL